MYLGSRRRRGKNTGPTIRQAGLTEIQDIIIHCCGRLKSRQTSLNDGFDFLFSLIKNITIIFSIKDVNSLAVNSRTEDSMNNKTKTLIQEYDYI